MSFLKSNLTKVKSFLMTLFEQNQIREILLIENCKSETLSQLTTCMSQWKDREHPSSHKRTKYWSEGNWDKFLAERCLHRQTLNKYLEQRKKKKAKLNRIKNLWHLLLRNFWPLSPKFYFWKGGFSLDYVSTQLLRLVLYFPIL